MGEKLGKENKNVIRKVEDGLLLVVPARICGKEVKTLIDSGETGCFVTPSCVARVGLKGLPCNVLLNVGAVKSIYPEVMSPMSP